MARKPPEADIGWRWMQLPAVFVDTFVVDVFQKATLVRLSFAEYTDRETASFYRSSVVMPVSDAKLLIERLTADIKEAEDALVPGSEFPLKDPPTSE